MTMMRFRGHPTYEILLIASAQQVFGASNWEQNVRYLKKIWGEEPNFNPRIHFLSHAVFDLDPALWERLVPAYLRWHMIIEQSAVRKAWHDIANAVCQCEEWKKPENRPFRHWLRHQLQLRDQLRNELNHHDRHLQPSEPGPTTK